VVGAPRLSIVVPEKLQEAATSGAIQLAFRSDVPSGWTEYAIAYDAGMHTANADLTHFRPGTLEVNTLPSDVLALWTILRVRWPSMADHLEPAPEAVRGITEPLWHRNTCPRNCASSPTTPHSAASSSTPRTALSPRTSSGCAPATEELVSVPDCATAPVPAW
jgi:hypothetical protein